MQTLALDAMLMAGDQRDVGLKTEPMGYDQRERECVCVKLCTEEFFTFCG